MVCLNEFLEWNEMLWNCDNQTMLLLKPFWTKITTNTWMNATNPWIKKKVKRIIQKIKWYNKCRCKQQFSKKISTISIWNTISNILIWNIRNQQTRTWVMVISTKYENNDPLFSAALRLNAFVKNAVAFL